MIIIILMFAVLYERPVKTQIARYLAKFDAYRGRQEEPP